MSLPRLSPEAYRRVTFLALVALVFIVISGGAVRLTGSGLGCPDWPTCDNDRLVAPLELHPMVEFINRVITGLVSAAVIIAVLGALRRVPFRADLVWWAFGLVIGVLGQIVLGGLTVLFDLAPQLVMGHFILSMVLVWNAVVLHKKASSDDVEHLVVTEDIRAQSRLMVAAASFVIFTGTIVTAAGPHGGDDEAKRLDVSIEQVARVHGILVMLFLALTIFTLIRLRRSDSPQAVRQRGHILLVVLLVQGAIGYTQYFTDIPPLLVGLHIAGACAVWVFTLRFHLGLRESDSESVLKGTTEPADIPLSV